MTIIGLIVALLLFRHFAREYRRYQRQLGDEPRDAWGCEWDGKRAAWLRHVTREADRHRRRAERDARRWARRFGIDPGSATPPAAWTSSTG